MQPKPALAAAGRPVPMSVVPMRGNTIQPLFGRKTKTGFTTASGVGSLGNTVVSLPMSVGAASTLFTGGGAMTASASAASATTASNVFGAFGTFSTAAAPVTLPIAIASYTVTSGFAVRSIYKSWNHRKALKKIADDLERQYDALTDAIFPPGGEAPAVESPVISRMIEMHVHIEEALDAIYYTLGQKSRKMKRKGLSLIPMLGAMGVGVHRLGRAIWKKLKGTKGKTRRAMAEKLWSAHDAGIGLASMAIAQLLGEKSWVKAASRGGSYGIPALERKMKSI